MTDKTPPSGSPPPGPREEPPLELPAMNTAFLDASQVEALLRDIEACGRIIEIIPKQVARGFVPDTAGITLARARELLADRAVRGLQLRYHHEGAEWWDTLMVLGEDRFRLVRIRHDFGNSPAAVNPPPP